MKIMRKFISVNLFLIIYIYALIYSATPKTITMIQGKELSYPFYDFIDISFNRETNINGEYISVQVYGTVSGINARNKICCLKENETHKSRFGLF